MSDRLTRRDLARLLGVGLLAGPLGAATRGGGDARAGTVGIAPLAADELGQVAASGALIAVSAAIAAATGAASGEAAAARLFSAGDTVGIKLSCLAGRPLSPRREVVEALVRLITAAGVPAGRIIVFERSSRELQRAGLPLRRSGGPYLCYGIDNDYDPLPSDSGAIGSCFARLVSTHCTALVSVGVVKDHDLAGVSAGLKNWYGVIHNPNKYHDNNCDPYVADVVNHPFIRGKLKLTLLDGVTAQYHGGPAFRARYAFPLHRVVASMDPVAVDAWAWRVLDSERRQHGLPSLAEAKRPPRFIATAAKYGLGVGDPSRIREVMA
ncbi:MAG: DUF362 domain-containing protein [Acidobacteria bacterium]|jgi:uncharacterized protein (DUF362 family)|nr:DUF362 domain-containing protein [Acidobacteriota bacterium]